MYACCTLVISLLIVDIHIDNHIANHILQGQSQAGFDDYIYYYYPIIFLTIVTTQKSLVMLCRAPSIKKTT